MTREEQCPVCDLVERRAINFSVQYDGYVMICECGAVLRVVNRHDIEVASKNYKENAA